jgi:hypothetical protein
MITVEYRQAEVKFLRKDRNEIWNTVLTLPLQDSPPTDEQWKVRLNETYGEVEVLEVFDWGVQSATRK